MSFFNFFGKVAGNVVNGSAVVADKVVDTTSASVKKAGELYQVAPSEIMKQAKATEITFKLGRVEGLQREERNNKEIKDMDKQLAKLNKMLGKETKVEVEVKGFKESFMEGYNSTRK